MEDSKTINAFHISKDLVFIQNYYLTLQLKEMQVDEAKETTCRDIDSFLHGVQCIVPDKTDDYNGYLISY